ncbi:hypothetical protein K445DRAFT_13006 [Daldinia sp. EC12]|nr:hypothetical protein K445DRAFT_13006 [Daldinia sp. EC12]
MLLITLLSKLLSLTFLLLRALFGNNIRSYVEQSFNLDYQVHQFNYTDKGSRLGILLDYELFSPTFTSLVTSKNSLDLHRQHSIPSNPASISPLRNTLLKLDQQNRHPLAITMLLY